MHNNIRQWIQEARKKLKTNTFSDADLDKLSDISSARAKKKQRLLYLHAASPSIRSEVIAMAIHEPVEGSITEIGPISEDEWKYSTVHAAVVDGWKIISFPDQRAPFDDREIDIIGYEFILQTMVE